MRIRLHWITAFCLAAVLSVSAAGQLQKAGPVRLDSGKISGALSSKNERVSVYKGIPYAAPPVGNLRWRAPRPVTPWDGVREATEFGPIQPQSDRIPGGATPTSVLSEDSLYLNVWTPAESASERLPVMVWIHGGGFRYGSGSTSIYDGTRLADHGVVVVTFNYRMHVLSGFAHPALTQESGHVTSGNYGFLDQIAALQWVRRNIGNFGGDPNNVTIFGESAGGISVTALMTSPLSESLFQRAIVESGSVGRIGTLEEAEEAGQNLLQEAGIEEGPDLLDRLRAMPFDELPGGINYRGGPVVDGYVFPGQPDELFAAGRQHDVPLIAGYNKHEATFFLRGRTPVPKTVAEYEDAVRERYGDRAEAILALYPAKSDGDVYWAEMTLRTDASLGVGVPRQLRGMFNVPSKGYMYTFTRVPPGPNAARMGASHAAELTYVFGTQYGPVAGSAPDRELSEAMMRYWTQFAKTGDPNVEGSPEWPAFERGHEGYIKLDTTITGGVDLKKDKIAILEQAGDN